MPAVLQRLMRHESVETGIAVYVDLDAAELTEDLYRAHESRLERTGLGTVAGFGRVQKRRNPRS
jgi:hypothetical protein